MQATQIPTTKQNKSTNKSLQSKSNHFLINSTTEVNDNSRSSPSSNFNCFKSIARNKIKQLHNTNRNEYNTLLINNMIFSTNSHLIAVFKDYMIYDFLDEFLKRSYNKEEINERIPKFANFYKNYLLFFCKPTWNNFKVNDIIQDYGEKKAECYYKENYKSKKGELSSSEEAEENEDEDEDEDDESDKHERLKEKKDIRKENIFTNDIKNDISDQSMITNINNSNFMDNTMTLRCESEYERIINGIKYKRNERENKLNSMWKSNEVTILGIVNNLNNNKNRNNKDKKHLNAKSQNEKNKATQMKNNKTLSKHANNLTTTGMAKQKIQRIIQKGIVSSTNLNNLDNKNTSSIGLKQSSEMKSKSKYSTTINHNSNNSNNSNNNLTNKPVALPIQSSWLKNKSRNRDSSSNWYGTNSNQNIHFNKTHTNASTNLNKQNNKYQITVSSKPGSGGSNHIKSSSILKTADSIWSANIKQNKNFTKTQNIEKWFTKYSPTLNNFHSTSVKQKQMLSQSKNKNNICNTDQTNSNTNNNTNKLRHSKNTFWSPKNKAKPIIKNQKSNCNIKGYTSSYNKINPSHWIKQSNDELMKLALSIWIESNGTSNNNTRNSKNNIHGSNWDKQVSNHTNTNWNININNHININTNNSNNNILKLNDNLNKKIIKNDNVANNIRNNLNKLSRNKNTGSGLTVGGTSINSNSNNNNNFFNSDKNKMYKTGINIRCDSKNIITSKQAPKTGYYTKSINSITSLLTNQKKIMPSKK